MPLPKIHDLFALLKGEKCFTALDLQSGYYHIKLDEEFIPKSAFITVFGKFKFLRLPICLSQGSSFFIHLIYDLFGLDKTSTQDSRYFAYLDDILIYSRTKREHLQMLDKAFKCLLKARLKIKLGKCLFFKEQIYYLGLLVRGTSILPLANKTEVFMKLKSPTNIKEVRHFLGLTGYYQKLICNCADITHLLNSLVCKLHDLLIHGILQLPNPNKPNLLFTDESKFCCSGVLTQASTEDLNEALLRKLTSEDILKSVESQTQDLQLKSNIIHPVAYISGSFSQSQCR